VLPALESFASSQLWCKRQFTPGTRPGGKPDLPCDTACGGARRLGIASHTPRVHNAIPVAGGLGSSAAAIVAGVSLAFAVAGRSMPTGSALRYATELEGHADNVAAALLGGLVVTATRADGAVLALRKAWPKEIRIICGDAGSDPRNEAIASCASYHRQPRRCRSNLQRSALLIAALRGKALRPSLDAVQDRLHQTCRARLIPGLAGILQMPRAPGLLGIVLSGSGPTVIALATEHFDAIGKSIAHHFERHGSRTIRCLDVAPDGHTITKASPPPHKVISLIPFACHFAAVSAFVLGNNSLTITDISQRTSEDSSQHLHRNCATGQVSAPITFRYPRTMDPPGTAYFLARKRFSAKCILFAFHGRERAWELRSRKHARVSTQSIFLNPKDLRRARAICESARFSSNPESWHSACIPYLVSRLTWIK